MTGIIIKSLDAYIIHFGSIFICTILADFVTVGKSEKGDQYAGTSVSFFKED